MAQREPKSVKAQMTKASLIVAAAAILRESGPEAVTYRKVAALAGVSTSSTLYYFDSISELLSEAGKYNIDQWATRAENVARKAEEMSPQQARSQAVELLLGACLPRCENNEYFAHYSQLLAAGVSIEVTSAYRQGRQRLDQAVSRILEIVSWNIPAPLAIALIDGAAVAAISEGRSVTEYISTTLMDLEKIISATDS